MRSLQEFRSPQDVFKTPDRLPPFFDENLVDPARVVKVFVEDPQAHIRVFYYQYLKLCFEVSHPNSDSLVQKIQELINNDTFQFIFYQEDDPSVFNDTQAKRLISQFFGVLSGGEITVLQVLNTYPIMDVIMVHFFRTLMILMDKAQSLDNFIARDELLSFLCSFFGIEVQLHDNCIKYIDTDVFVYDHTERQTYMAYINYTEDESNNSPTYQNESTQQQKVQPQPYETQQQQNSNYVAPLGPISGQAPPGQNSGRAPSGSIGLNKESYIASEFFDYTQDNTAGRLADKATALKGSDHFINHNPIAKSQVQDVKPSLPSIPKPQEEKTTSNQPYNTDSNKYSYENKYQENAQKSTYSHQEVSKSSSYQQNESSSKYSHTQAYAPPPTPADIGSYQASQPQKATNNYDYNPVSSQYGSSQAQNSYQPQPQPQGKAQTNNIGKDIFYNPKVVDSHSYNSANSKVQTSNYNYTGSSEVKTTSQYTSSYQGVNATVAGTGPSGITSATSGKKKPFGLNVSEEFTNSFTRKAMAEPYRTNVASMITRARQFRTSLANFVIK